MRHLFYVHSTITSRMALRMIEHLKLDREDVVWLLGRGQTAPFQAPSILESETKGKLPKPSWFFPSCRSGLKKWSHHFSTEIESEKFIAYLPQTFHVLPQLILNHPDCEGYYLIEEGMLAYYEKDISGFTSLLDESCLKKCLKKLYYSLNYGNQYSPYTNARLTKHRSYLGCVTWNEYGFPGFPKRISLECPFFLESDGKNLDAIIALDAIVDAGLVSGDDLVQALRLIFSDLKKMGINRVGIKLHPETKKHFSHNPPWLDKALSGEAFSFDTLILPEDTVLEDILKSQDIPVYTIISSVGLYGALLGRPSKSSADYLANLSGTRFREHLALLPQIWEQRVSQL